jgi:hypothetical protein
MAGLVRQEIPHEMLLKKDMAQERKRLTSANEQPNKEHGYFLTESIIK